MRNRDREDVALTFVPHRSGSRAGYSVIGGVSPVFREDVVGDAHILDACKAADLNGITFKDAAKR
jgi:hypothetical protein